MECTFFVYAFHFLPVRLIGKLAAMAFPGNVFVAVVLYLAMPAIGYAVCWQVAKFLQRFSPRVWRALSGGRGAAKARAELSGGTERQGR